MKQIISFVLAVIVMFSFAIISVANKTDEAQNTCNLSLDERESLSENFLMAEVKTNISGTLAKIKISFHNFKTLIYIFFTKIAGSLSPNLGNKYSTAQLKCYVVDVSNGKIIVTPDAGDDLYGRIDTIIFKENSAIDETSYTPKKGDNILVMYNYKSLHRISNQWTISIVFAIYNNRS